MGRTPSRKNKQANRDFSDPYGIESDMAIAGARRSPQCGSNRISRKKQGPKKVTETWKSYLDHLSQSGMSPEIWAQKRTDLFIDLLHAMSAFLGYNFTQLEISREVYAPKLHGDIETDQTIIRQGLAKLFKGEIAVPMDVRSFPTGPTVLQNHSELQELMLSWLSGKRSVKVDLGGEADIPNQGSRL